ncbi:hypothetical protein H4219_000219 [Mycoemilia scoparia]|uniref:Uncharacterized protein n=1 Tax=Mycoemilia scoparia TaxID=417184 RepID=A0A9W8A7W6_9FUNG|nr:hypothetical protein H4219_000219 [Mycoemilia scoparia]
MTSYSRPDIKGATVSNGGLFKRMLRKGRPAKLNPVGISSQEVFRYIDSAGIDEDTPNIVHEFQSLSVKGTPHTAIGVSFYPKEKSSDSKSINDNKGNVLSKASHESTGKGGLGSFTALETLSKINTSTSTRDGEQDHDSTAVTTPVSPASTLPKKRNTLWRNKFSLSNIRETASLSLRKKSLDINSPQTLSARYLRQAPSIANMINPPSPPHYTMAKPRPPLLNVPGIGDNEVRMLNENTKKNQIGTLNFPSPIGSPFQSPLPGHEDASWPTESSSAASSATPSMIFSKQNGLSEKAPKTNAQSNEQLRAQASGLENIDESFLATINHSEVLESRRHRRRVVRSNTAAPPPPPPSAEASMSQDNIHHCRGMASATPPQRFSTSPSAPNSPVMQSMMVKAASDIGHMPFATNKGSADKEGTIAHPSSSLEPIDDSAEAGIAPQYSTPVARKIQSSSTTVLAPQTPKRRALSVVNESALRSSMAAATRAVAGCPVNSLEANIPPVPPLPNFIRTTSVGTRHHDPLNRDSLDEAMDTYPSITGRASESYVRRPSAFSIRNATFSNVKCDVPALTIAEKAPLTPASENYEMGTPTATSPRPFSIKSPRSSMTASSASRGKISACQSSETATVIQGSVLPVGGRNTGDKHIRRKIRDQLASSVAFDQLFDDPEFTINISL